MGKRRWEVRFVYCCKTTIPAIADDWNIDRFSLLRDHLASLTDESGEPLCNVTARNREVNTDGNDAVLSVLDTTDFDELWLFAVDSGNGLTVADCQGITRFRQRGGGILAIRDHQDLGSSLCTLGGVGRAHFFILDILTRMNLVMCVTIRTRKTFRGPTITLGTMATIRRSIQSRQSTKCC